MCVCVFFLRFVFHYQIIINEMGLLQHNQYQVKFFEPLLQLIYVVWTKRKLPVFVFFPILSFICFYRLTFHIFFFFLFIDAVGHLIMDWETSIVSLHLFVGQRLLEYSSMYTLASYAEHLKLHVYSLFTFTFS